jgi:diguanylate cyclase (GGDEF)-like protein
MAAPDKLIEMLHELGAPSRSGTRAALLARALRTAGPLVDADAVAVVLGSARRSEERLVLHAGSELPALLPLPAEGSEALRSLAGQPQSIALADLSENAPFAGDTCPGVEAGPVFFAPLAQHGGRPAYLAVYRRRGRARFTAAETQSLLLLAAWLGAALEGLRLAGRTQKLAVADDQTETYTDRFLRAALKREIRRAHRYGQELSLALVTVDRFEDLRDATAEAGAGPVLKEMATLLGQHVRSFDVLGRCGEDAFALVLPQTGKTGAMEVAERVRVAVAGHAFPPGGAGSISASLAVATFPHDAIDAEALWAVAERVRSEAKDRGGNCVATTGRRAA